MSETNESENLIEVYKDIICSESVHFTHEDKVDILVIILRYSKTSEQYIKEYETEGTRINLNKLPESVIVEIYKLIKRRLDLDDI